MLRLAIIGRPNVGKSTLYNRLAGKRDAIVHDEPGVTRDRKYGMGSIGSFEFEIVDTPGLDDIGKTTLAGRMSEQSLAALADIHVILFVLDGRAGIMPEDMALARRLHKTGIPVIPIINKAESPKAVENTLSDIHRLGMLEAVAISAEHGEGLASLYEALAPYEPPQKASTQTTPAERPIRMAILGRPNVGKSTLLNSLLGQERVLTGAESGMTRDSVSVALHWQERDYVLVDTAGMRRKSRIDEAIESMSVSATLQALRYTDVAILMLDATEPLEKQDNTIASLIEREGRACVIALNKADTITIDDEYVDAFRHRLSHVVPHMKGIPIIPMVATTGQGCDELMEAVNESYRIWNTRISTSQLNIWLEDMISHHSPPLVKGRRLKFRYITQTKARPPTLVIFSNMNKEVPEAYTRYLTNALREQFNMPGVPIRLMLRTGKNPYAPKSKKK